MDIAVLFSGGIDSTKLVIKSLNNGFSVLLIHYSYEHPAKEAERVAVKSIYEILSEKYPDRILLNMYEIPIINNMDIGFGSKGSRVVVNRNSIFLNLAINVASAKNIKIIQYGAVLNDSSDYSDCTPVFLKKINSIATDWGITIEAPLIDTLKSENHMENDILEKTSSCYQPALKESEWISCGECNSCRSNN